MADVAVALLDADAAGRSPAAALAGHTGAQVVATTPDDHVTVVGDLARDHGLVVGVSCRPWPRHAHLHEVTGTAVAAYRGVVAWHGLPRLLDELAQVAAPGARAGAHLLVTAPDPDPDAAPEELTFLREVAEALAARVEPTSRSIAWRGRGRAPTAEDALTTVVEAHGRRDVVEVPVAPGTGADVFLQAAAERLGARLTTADLSARLLIAALADVVATVVDHERPPPSATGSPKSPSPGDDAG